MTTPPINCFQSFGNPLTSLHCILDENRSVLDASQTLSSHRIHSNCQRSDVSETLSARFRSQKIDLQSASRALKKSWALKPACIFSLVCPNIKICSHSKNVMVQNLSDLEFHVGFFRLQPNFRESAPRSPKNLRALKLACIFQDLLTKYCYVS